MLGFVSWLPSEREDLALLQSHLSVSVVHHGLVAGDTQAVAWRGHESSMTEFGAGGLIWDDMRENRVGECN